MSRLGRRDALALLGAGGLAAGVAGCQQVAGRIADARPPRRADEPPLPPTGDITPAVRLLNRAAFGPAPGDVAYVEKIGGPRAWVEEQLAAPSDDDDETPGLRLRLRGLEALNATNTYDLKDLPEEAVIRQMQQAAILRAVYSRWQLRERMVDFWSNHFNVYARKNLGAYLKTADDVAVVRAHALGKFPDLLRASARSPAMLGYLDNDQNRKGVPNENYARELMELHTLGVGGGYTQKDVQEVARCLTGWTIEDRFLHRKGTFRFDPARHDDGPKVVLGERIAPGGGESDGDRVLEIVSRHPSTAGFLARKMVRYFVGIEDGPLVGEVSTVYTKTGGDIPAMLRSIFGSPAFLSAPPVMKRPFDYLASALRATDAQTDGGKGVQEHLARMGQPLFQWPMPDGYPDRTAAWTGSLIHRWNFAVALAGGEVPGTTVDLSHARAPDEWLAALLARRADEPAIAPLRQALSGLARNATETVALLLASPDFQWR
jgi:uncharacterized protein (DUF1800 family)